MPSTKPAFRFACGGPPPLRNLTARQGQTNLRRPNYRCKRQTHRREDRERVPVPGGLDGRGGTSEKLATSKGGRCTGRTSWAVVGSPVAGSSLGVFVVRTLDGAASGAAIPLPHDLGSRLTEQGEPAPAGTLRDVAEPREMVKGGAHGLRDSRGSVLRCVRGAVPRLASPPAPRGVVREGPRHEPPKVKEPSRRFA